MNILTILHDIFIDKEYKNIPFSPSDLTEHYKEELGILALDEIYIATSYHEIEKSIIRYKYESKREYVDIFVDLLAKLGEQHQIFSDKKSVIVPVPMHWSRYILRGFDHTHTLAKKLAQITGLPYQKHLSTKWSRHQSKLSREKRLENKKNRFTMKYHVLIPETVILIDDIISTGSTANECAKVLKQWGVKRVIGLFLASNL